MSRHEVLLVSFSYYYGLCCFVIQLKWKGRYQTANHQLSRQFYEVSCVSGRTSQLLHKSSLPGPYNSINIISTQNETKISPLTREILYICEHLIMVGLRQDPPWSMDPKSTYSSSSYWTRAPFIPHNSSRATINHLFPFTPSTPRYSSKTNMKNHFNNTISTQYGKRTKKKQKKPKKHIPCHTPHILSNNPPSPLLRLLMNSNGCIHLDKQNPSISKLPKSESQQSQIHPNCFKC